MKCLFLCDVLILFNKNFSSPSSNLPEFFSFNIFYANCHYLKNLSLPWETTQKFQPVSEGSTSCLN